MFIFLIRMWEWNAVLENTFILVSSLQIWILLQICAAEIFPITSQIGLTNLGKTRHVTQVVRCYNLLNTWVDEVGWGF
jgi:hypothetical protein